VGEAAAGDPSGGAGGVERRRVHLDLLLGRLDRDRRAGRGRGRGGDGEARGGGVEEAREERLAGAVGERHRRREIRRVPRISRGWVWRGRFPRALCGRVNRTRRRRCIMKACSGRAPISFVAAVDSVDSPTLASRMVGPGLWLEVLFGSFIK
jgi:hypothetical protein